MSISEVGASPSQETQPPKDFKQRIKDELKKGIGGPIPQSPNTEHAEWVRLLYTQYTTQFLSDNNRIWTTATIFLPLSLAGLVKLSDLGLYDTALLGAGSSLLAWFWLVIADHHRSFQTTSKDMTKAIEEHIGFVFPEQKAMRTWLMNLKPLYTVQKVRYLMYYCIVSIWLFAIGGKVYHRISSPQPSTPTIAPSSQQ